MSEEFGRKRDELIQLLSRTDNDRVIYLGDDEWYCFDSGLHMIDKIPDKENIIRFYLMGLLVVRVRADSYMRVV